MQILMLLIEFSFPERFRGALCVKRFKNSKHSPTRSPMGSLPIQVVSFSDFLSQRDLLRASHVINHIIVPVILSSSRYSIKILQFDIFF